MHGRGRGGSWPAPLYHAQWSQALVIRQDNKEMEHKAAKPVEMGKGKRKEVDNMDIDENIELNDDDLLVEEGVLGVGEYEIEDPSALISGSTSHGYEFTHEAKGNKNLSLKDDGVENLSEQLLNCSMDNAKVTMGKKGSQGNLREKQGQMANTGQMSITKKTEKVALPKPPANT
ncbi:hypothetical protein AALP_AA8G269400 [Arabis alpina]|uniref:Uncharacterized protein n=1 Tax=Arabis alpina TaxID=50452 RepID=A0A087G9P6_ARAAL|nr:hypothetical protein AALP_AA8G269400 [Arabis alpina]